MRPKRTGAPAHPVVVTGSSGLATALVARLEAEGEPVLPVPVLPPADRLRAVLPAGAAVVHLAPGRDPGAAPAARARDLDATRDLLDVARAAGVRRVVLVTSTEVYRAQPGQVPLAEDAPVGAQADTSLVGDWVEVERLADHGRRAGVDVVVVRPAALAGLEPPLDGTLLRSLAGSRLLAVRGVEPLWQLCHADDLVGALVVAARGGVERACAVASGGWLTQAEVERLSGRRRLELPAAVVLSTAERLHRVGVASGTPDDLAVLLAPVVVEPARLRAAGWEPAWTAEEVLLAHLAARSEEPRAARPAAYAAGTAGATAAVLGTAALVRRARRRRRR